MPEERVDVSLGLDLRVDGAVGRRRGDPIVERVGAGRLQQPSCDGKNQNQGGDQGQRLPGDDGGATVFVVRFDLSQIVFADGHKAECAGAAAMASAECPGLWRLVGIVQVLARCHAFGGAVRDRDQAVGSSSPQG